MIVKLIGLKRFVILLAALGLNGLLAAGYFWGMVPMRERAVTEQSSLQGQISSLQTKINDIKKDIVDIRENLPKYEALKNAGLFEGQDRFELQRKLGELQAKAEISGFSFNVKDIESLQNADAETMEHKLISSRVTLDKLSTTFDMPVYDLLRSIPAVFPQHARVQEINIQRASSQKIDAPTLQKISAGQSVGFIQTTVLFDWMTLVPKEISAAPGTDGNAQGFRGR